VRSRSPLVLALVLTVGALTAGTAIASDGGPTWMACADGRSVDQGHIAVGVSMTGIGHPWLKVTGDIVPCRTPGRHDAYAIVGFLGPRAQRAGYMTFAYRGHQRGPGRSLLLHDLFVGSSPGLRAVCLSSREGPTYRSSHRIDCVAVTYTAQDRRENRPPRVGRHLRPDDPLVRGAAVEMNVTEPGCTACWS
jgi:hypothetical protein